MKNNLINRILLSIPLAGSWGWMCGALIENDTLSIICSIIGGFFIGINAKSLIDWINRNFTK
jgi:hypothetical protein